jgi:hypothetical protein
MRRDRKRGPLYTPGFRMSDIEFFAEERPAKKKLPLEKPAKKRHRRGRPGKGAMKRLSLRKYQKWQDKLHHKRAKRLVKQLATQIAFDLLEIRAMNFEENEIKFREQQQREAKAYAEKFTAAFREAVQKEAASQTAA